MKQVLKTSVAIVVLCLFMLALPQAAAQAQSISSPSARTHASATTVHPKAIERPNASGGGCSNTVYSGNRTRFVTYSACISYWGLKVYPDTYVSFGAVNAGLWRACRVTIYVYEHNQYAFGSTFDCLAAAKSNASNVNYALSNYGIVWPGQAWHAEVWVYYYYNSDRSGYYGPRISSPVEYI
jgi:hypothetical protein